MSLFSRLFGEPEIRALDQHNRDEVNQMISQLVRIGRQDDFLSLQPGGPFDLQYHHREARDIGKRLHSMGGVALMAAVRRTIQRKLGPVLAEHLDHCWKGIGDWQV
jgi:hypothetical protein